MTRSSTTLSRLSESLPPQETTALVHGDYRLDNVIVTPQGEVAAVVDWELCTLGDPLADLVFGEGVALDAGGAVYTLADVDHVEPLGNLGAERHTCNVLALRLGLAK